MLFINQTEWDNELSDAIESGNLEVIRKKIDSDGKLIDKISVHYLARWGHPRAVHYLLQAGCSSRINTFDDFYWTPLMCAADADRITVARLLLEFGAEVNCHDEEHIGDTAIRQTIYKGSLEMVQLLISAGADPTIAGWMGLSALDLAEERLNEDPSESSAAIFNLLRDGL